MGRDIEKSYVTSCAGGMNARYAAGFLARFLGPFDVHDVQDSFNDGRIVSTCDATRFSKFLNHTRYLLLVITKNGNGVLKHYNLSL